MTESGNLDLFVFLGPTPAEVFDSYTFVTGRPVLPQLFALGYHQCRWNYNDEKDVEQVDAKFDELDIPYDVLWLDIEHTDGKRYFTWDPVKFPNPIKMQENLASRGRKVCLFSAVCLPTRWSLLSIHILKWTTLMKFSNLPRI